MNHRWLFILFFTVSCAHQSPSESVETGLPEKPNNAQLLVKPEKQNTLQSQTSETEALLRSLKLKIDVLEEENSALKSLVKQKEAKKIKLKKRFILPVESEQGLYRFVVESYDHNRFERFDVAADFFLRNYSLSSKVDDIYFLQAEYLSNRGKTLQSLELVKRCLEDYPRSNRRASFLKLAVKLYRRLNLMKPAQSVLMKIAQDYPLSPEALWVKQELGTQQIRM